MPYTPKTNWTPQDAPGPSDFNRIEQGIADAAAVAETAQQTADTALSAAQAAGQAADSAQSAAAAANQAIADHAAAEAPHPGHANLASENTFTARQKFNAGIKDGGSNADMSYLYSLQVPLDTRNIQVMSWTAKGNPTTIRLRNGTTVLAEATITYNSKEKPTKAVVTYNTPDGTKTVTHTLTWTDLTKLASWTKVVS